MAEKLFLKISREKQNKIIESALLEFSNKSYNEASTNNIVKFAGISKGSLFKYFKSKEDLYLFVLDFSIKELVKDISQAKISLEKDIFETIIKYAEVEFDWHINNPYKYKLINKAFTDENSSLYKKIMENYQGISDNIYFRLLEDIDGKNLKYEKEKISNLVKWILEGFNRDFSKVKDTGDNLLSLKNEYIKELRTYIEIIKEITYRR